MNMFKIQRMEPNIDEGTSKPKFNITLSLDIEEMERLKVSGGTAYGDTEWAPYEECIGWDFLNAMNDFENEKKNET